jgi:hypothetical protein
MQQKPAFVVLFETSVENRSPSRAEHSRLRGDRCRTVETLQNGNAGAGYLKVCFVIEKVAPWNVDPNLPGEISTAPYIGLYLRIR